MILFDYLEWDEIPETFKPIFEREMADPKSSIHCGPGKSSFDGYNWSPPDEVPEDSDIMLFNTVPRDEISNYGLPDFEAYQRGSDHEGRAWSMRFGFGQGFDTLPEDIAPPRPSRLVIEARHSAKRVAEFMRGFQKLSVPSVFLIGEDVFDILTGLYDIPDSRLFPMTVVHGETPVGRMYMYDPEIRKDIVDIERSIVRLRYKPEKPTFQAYWEIQVRGPCFLLGSGVFIAKTSLFVSRPVISKDLHFTLRQRKIESVSAESVGLVGAQYGAYEPTLLVKHSRE